MPPEKILSLLDPDVQIGTVPMDPGLSNVKADPADSESETRERILGTDTEDGEVNEGAVRYDIRFSVSVPAKDGEREAQETIDINVEMQKTRPTKYRILNRSGFYAARLICSQKERVFSGQEYDKIHKVYSIWIVPEQREPLQNHIHMADHQILGSHTWEGRMDLLNVVMIGVPKELAEKGRNELRLHRLLGTLFSMGMPMEERKKILQEEYHLWEKSDLQKEVMEMCDLGEGLLEWAEAKTIRENAPIWEAKAAKSGEEGEARGEARGEANTTRRIILAMHEQGFNNMQITSITGKDEVYVLNVINGVTPTAE